MIENSDNNQNQQKEQMTYIQQRKLNEQGVQTMQILESSNHYHDEAQAQTLLTYQGKQETIEQNQQDKVDREQSDEEYERIIDELNKKLIKLKQQYNELMNMNKQQNQQITIKDSPQITNSPIRRLTMNKVYEYQIKVSKNIENQRSYDNQQQQNTNSQEEQKQSQQIIPLYMQNKEDNNNQQQLIANQNQTTNSPRQQTHNTEEQALNSYPHQQVNPYISQTVINQQVERQSYSLSVLSRSLSNLVTLRQSIDTLSYERISQLMSIQWLTSKISFKQKHYPSLSSTPQQLKLYAKRLLKLLINPLHKSTANPTSNYIAEQDSLFNQTYVLNDIEYDQTDQYVAFFTKQIKNLIIICYYNKTIYIGPFTTSSNSPLRQGHAIQIRQNKYIYQGHFHADKKHGYGYIHFINKYPKIYSGYWIDGFIDGTGKQIYHTGQTYEGDFKLGFRDGIGLIYYHDDKIHGYKGQFYDGYKHGNGFQKFLNGDTYTGSYIKDKFHGQGEYKWKNGTIYKGTFHQGQKHGQGLLIFTNGKQILKQYDHNIQLNIQYQDQNKTIRTSAISNITQSKVQEKHSLIQEKPKSSRNHKSQSSKSVFSAKSLSKNESIKQIKSKKTIAQLMKQKQLQQDLQNLNTILKPTAQQNSKTIFSLKKLSQTQNVMGKMYNISDRATMKISEHIGMDMLGLGRTGIKRKSLISFDSWQRLQDGGESMDRGLGYNMRNFQQF